MSLCILLTCCGVNSLPSGAPSDACFINLEPWHFIQTDRAFGQSTHAPYEIVLSKEEMTRDETLNGKYFIGLFRGNAS